MGYTHYFTQKQSVDPLMWQNFREHMDKLYHHYLAQSYIRRADMRRIPG